jgi:hypothetical protein
MEQSIKLFHISDQPGISLFEPRPSPHLSANVQGSMVWAVDQDHIQNYLLPRDCPRVTFFAGQASSPADVASLIGPSGARWVIAVEACWLARIQSQRLVRYEFEANSFEMHDETAGYWISRASVAPIAETRIDDILSDLLKQDVELRIMHSLWRLREAVIHSSLEFSIIRMRNAQQPAEGFDAYYPLPLHARCHSKSR